MTNLQYMKLNCGGLSTNADELTAILTDAGLSPNADADMAACDLVLYNHFSIVIRQALMNVSEGGMSISWNMEAVKAWYSLLCAKTGQPDVVFGRPVIRDRSNMW